MAGTKIWKVTYGDCIYDGFTIDDKGNYPTDYEIAKNRLERRKDFLEKYYRLTTSTDLATQFALLPVSLALFPLFIADEYRVHVFGSGDHEGKIRSNEELE